MSLLVFAIALTLNPHPDLWLTDASFARLYCTEELEAYLQTANSLRDLELALERETTREGANIDLHRESLAAAKKACSERLAELEAAITAARNRGRFVRGQFVLSMTPIPSEPR